MKPSHELLREKVAEFERKIGELVERAILAVDDPDDIGGNDQGVDEAIRAAMTVDEADYLFGNRGTTKIIVYHRGRRVRRLRDRDDALRAVIVTRRAETQIGSPGPSGGMFTRPSSPYSPDMSRAQRSEHDDADARLWMSWSILGTLLRSPLRLGPV
jgi:hypothetical protein